MTGVDTKYRSEGRMKISKTILVAALLLGPNAYATAQERYAVRRVRCIEFRSYPLG
jgi:hypothetical protein